MTYLKLPKKGLKHGRNYTYTRYGCKCPKCRDAHKEALKDYTQRAKLSLIKAKGYSLELLLPCLRNMQKNISLLIDLLERKT